jgi:hypothetical protein
MGYFTEVGTLMNDNHVAWISYINTTGVLADLQEL